MEPVPCSPSCGFIPFFPPSCTSFFSVPPPHRARKRVQVDVRNRIPHSQCRTITPPPSLAFFYVFTSSPVPPSAASFNFRIVDLYLDNLGPTPAFSGTPFFFANPLCFRVAPMLLVPTFGESSTHVLISFPSLRSPLRLYCGRRLVHSPFSPNRVSPVFGHVFSPVSSRG